MHISADLRQRVAAAAAAASSTQRYPLISSTSPTASLPPGYPHPHPLYNGAGQYFSATDDSDGGPTPTTSSRRPRLPPSLTLFARDPTLSGLLYVTLLLVYVSMIVFTYVADRHLPAPLPTDVPPSQFSEGRARLHLHALLSSGVRNTGSPANEVYAPRYILTQLHLIRTHALPGYVLEVDVQRPSGSFDLNFLGGFTSSYQNVTNILARLYYKGPDDPPSIDRRAVSFLVSAHFDSALGSPAASDDAANIASMLEIAHNLAHSRPLPHAVIFNFNGAEESILQAAHGFITQHPWTPSIAAFLNAEGAGGSGRELVFQLGPSHAWLAFAYARAAPHPFASSIAQDIFQSGVIPSDTDFRIYRDYGGLSGVDMAYITDGFVYHTALDDEAHVLPGSMQRAGENMLATIIAIVQSPQLVFAHPSYRHHCQEEGKAKTPAQSLKDVIGSHRVEFHRVRGRSTSEGAEGEGVGNETVGWKLGSIQSIADHLEEYTCDEHEMTGHAVFFDCVGLLMVIYSSRTARIVNGATILLTLLYLLTMHRTVVYTWKRTLQSLLVLLASLVASVLSAFLVAGLLVAVDHTMRWYARPILAAGLYSIPTLLTMITIQRKATQLLFGDVSYLKDRYSTVSPWVAEEQCFLSTLVLYVTFLTLLTLLNVSSALVLMLLCLLPVTGRTLGKLLDRLQVAPVPRPPSRSWLFLLLYCASLWVPTVLLAYACYVVVYFFLPVMGRSGTAVVSELIMAGLMSVVTFVCGTISLSLAHLDRRWKLTSRVLLGILALSLLAALTLPAYTPMHPKRVVAQHVRRTWHAPHTYTPSTPLPIALSPALRNDSGVWMNGLDWQTLRPLTGLRWNATQRFGWRANELALATPLPCTGVYCEMPYFYPFKSLVTNGVYLSAPPLTQGDYDSRLWLDRVEEYSDAGDDRHRRRYHFVSEGAHHQVLLLRNVVGREDSAELVGWSFHDDATHHPIKGREGDRGRTGRIDKASTFPFSLGPFYDAESTGDRVTREDYFTFFSSGVPDHPPASSDPPHRTPAYPELRLPPELEVRVPRLDTLPTVRRWQFWLEVRNNPRAKGGEGGGGGGAGAMGLEVGVVNHWLDASSEVLEAVREDLPDWTTVVHWVATWDGYVIR